MIPRKLEKRFRICLAATFVLINLVKWEYLWCNISGEWSDEIRGTLSNPDRFTADYSTEPSSCTRLANMPISISQTLTLPSESFDLVVMARYVPVEEQESEHLKWMRLAMEMVCIFLRID